MTTALNILTRPQAERYKKLKLFIKVWVSDRFEVGKALAEIKEDKLYRTEYPTFEEFVKTEYGIERAHAYRLIEAAEVKRLSPKGDISNISQANALAKVSPEKRGEVMAKAGADGKVTAKSIEAAAKPTRTIDLDRTGLPIPESILADWQRAEETASELMGKVSDVKCAVERGLDDIIFAEVTNSTVADLQNAYTALKTVQPWAVCTACGSHQRKTCRLCKGRGFISKFLFDHAVTAETKKLREKGKK
jgi:hypothetical protein